ncbi:hypothetical protein [Candidatus Odyssella acanthamoebae]|uniref:F-box domain-containing protein n=1 Tax=Candidatus Odyssella acanthamoebae TaxID=91604 RepID=A0A077AUN1_9PROT|nr:hypothetical protein [Candidatus Paracaedibacter acanthamoebae]AIK96887.1 hypothetical protein ID47_09290 [Candidatus Paracaedibacter acanthamoebae]
MRNLILFLMISSLDARDELPVSQVFFHSTGLEESTIWGWDLLPNEMKELVVSQIKLHDLPIFKLVNRGCYQLALNEERKRYTPPVRLSFLDPQKSPVSDLMAIEIKLKNEKTDVWKSYIFPYAQNTRLVPLGCAEDFCIQLPYEALPLRVTVDFMAGYFDKDSEVLASWRGPIHIGTLKVSNIFYRDAVGNKKTVEAIRFTPQKILFKHSK